MNRDPIFLPIAWFADLHHRRELIVHSSYQRKNIWTLKDRQYFLDTIFRNYPSPAILLHGQTNESGNLVYHVVDGRQRLETIFMFHKNQIKISQEFGDEKYAGKLFKDLELDDPSPFWKYEIMTDMVSGLDPNMINEVLDRLNRFSKNLNEQELRHARFEGWFIKHVENESKDPFWEKVNVGSRLNSKRMRDNQFISELLMIILENKSAGFDQYHISEIYEQYDDIANLDFDEESFIIKKEQIKKFVENVNDVKFSNKNYSVIEKWANNPNDFYTLWSVIALSDVSQLPSPEIFSKKYDSFMNKVSKVSDGGDVVHVKVNQSAYDYHSNLKTDSTDRYPRTERQNILERELL